MRACSMLLIVGAVLTFTGSAHGQTIDWEKVDAALGRKAAVTEDVHRYGFPRSDLSVVLDGVTLRPAFALGGWIAFKPMGGDVMVMGDLVLLEAEVGPVMAKLIANGVEITAIHNHLLRASPAPIYMHVGGMAIRSSSRPPFGWRLSESKTPLQAPPASAPAPAIDLDTTQLDQIIGAKGRQNGGVYQFAAASPRSDYRGRGAYGAGCARSAWRPASISSRPGGGKAAITGDFVLSGDEVNPVDQDAA